MDRDAYVRVRVVVSGSVQGVFYRATCAARAEQAGVSGFVRNLPDGRVEAAFEGEPSAVRALVAWCSRGPPGARVDHVESVDEPPRGDRAFRITR
jgi:acylphosphatase